ncbi:MAG: glycosyltransferase 87 family protein [Actinomycetes bacterium]
MTSADSRASVDPGTATAAGSRWYDRPRSGTAVAVAWLVTRLLTLGILATFERFVVGDVFYYWRKIRAMGDVGLANTLVEYPTPVVWLLTVPYGLGGGTRVGYLIAFVAAMLALDAAFTQVLWRRSRGGPGSAVTFWLAFVLLIGPLAYLRFDILPAVLAGGALLAARRRPWVTGALTGLGAAIKLWPALLIPSFLAHRADRKAAGLGFVVAGVGLAAVSLLAGGWDRLVSPLTWQSDRGLQIESVWTTPVMVARALNPRRWLVEMSDYQAYEIFGPGVAPWLTVSTVATVLGLVVIVALWVRAFRAPAPSAVAVGLAVLATVAIMTVTNKTLSPQYLLWLGGPMAALLLLARREPADRTLPRRLAWQLLALALLTQLVFPVFYNGLLGSRGDAMLVAATLVTTLRNLALVAFTVEVCLLAWRSLPARALRTGS